MALQPCRECGAQVSTEAVACPNCGIGEPTRGAGVGQFKGPVNRYRTKGVRPPKKKVNWSIGLLPVTVGVLLLEALVVGLILIWNASTPTNSTESTSTPRTSTPSTSNPTPSASTGSCAEFSPPRQGWLLDYDRVNEVRLWSAAAQPPGNSVRTIVSLGGPGLSPGESYITDVTRQCSMPDGIFYYYVQWDDAQSGWVDVSYLYWGKPPNR